MLELKRLQRLETTEAVKARGDAKKKGMHASS
jgi:hypothetical protein